MRSPRRHFLRARMIAPSALVIIICVSASGNETQNAAPSLSETVRQPIPITLSETTPEEPPRRLTPRGEAPVDDSEQRSRLPAAGSVISALAVVLIIALAAARLWKAHGPRLPGGLPNSAAEVLGRCRIEQRQSLYLVRVGSKILVIGSGGGELTTLSEIADPAEVDLISGQCRSQGGGSSPFARMFEARRTADDSASQRRESAISSPFENGPRPFKTQPLTPEQRLANRLRARPTDEEAERVA